MARSLEAAIGAALSEWLGIAHLKETVMAQFDRLNQALDAQGQEITAAVQRVADDVDALKAQIADLELDTADQEAVDAAVARVEASTEALRAIDPVKDEQPTEPVEPEQPADENPTA